MTTETTPGRPTRPTRPVPTYTHLAQLGLRDYDSFNSYWHGDGPRPRKTHACNPAEGEEGTFKALCGTRIVLGRRDMLEGHHSGTSAWPAAEGGWVTCRGCRRKLATD